MKWYFVLYAVLLFLLFLLSLFFLFFWWINWKKFFFVCGWVVESALLDGGEEETSFLKDIKSNLVLMVEREKNRGSPFFLNKLISFVSNEILLNSVRGQTRPSQARARALSTEETHKKLKGNY